MLDQLPMSRKQLRTIKDSLTFAVCIWHGAIRSGKTIASLVAFLLFIARAPRGGELVIVGRTRDAIWRNIVGPLQDPEIFGKQISRFVIGNHGAPTVKILGRTVHVLGASDAKAEKVIRGMTVAGAYADEITTLPEEFFTQLLGRMSVRGAQLFGTTNPDNPAHWFKKKYLDRVGIAGDDGLPHWRVWHFVMDDNPSLSDEFKARRKAEFTGLWYRRFILGEWVAAEGAIYPMWDPARMVIPHDQLPPMERLLAVGVDYGTTNASTGLLLGMAGGKLYLADEWRHDPAISRVTLTDSQLSASLREHYKDQRAEWMFVDPAAASFKAQLFADGLSNVADAVNDVLYGIRTFASLLGTGQLLISDRCTGLISEAPGYAWDPAATEKGEDKPIKTADHSLDGARYAIASSEVLWRGRLAEPLTAAA